MASMLECFGIQTLSIRNEPVFFTEDNEDNEVGDGPLPEDRSAPNPDCLSLAILVVFCNIPNRLAFVALPALRGDSTIGRGRRMSSTIPRLP